jgi:hypothetical protein
MCVRMLSFAAKITRLPQGPTSEQTDPFSIEASAIFHTQGYRGLFFITNIYCGIFNLHLKQDTALTEKTTKNR